MNKPHTVKKPAPQDWHKAHVKASLEMAGWSLRGLSMHHGYAPSTLTHVFRSQYPNAEKIIADAIGVHPMEIWPSRYDEHGNPKLIRPSFPRHRPDHWAKPPGKRVEPNDTVTNELCNVNVAEVE